MAPLDEHPRQVVTGDGATVVVRPVLAADARPLSALYQRLPAAERVSRVGVFDTYDHGFAGRVASIAERGGRGLVAELDAPARGGPDVDLGGSGMPELVGEAHYEPFDDGDAQMALVVVPEWRDELGPVLFDAVLADAAAHGLVNLEVDAMRTDEWVRGLIEGRAGAVRPSHDWLSTRLLVATDGGVPVWHEAPGPRVLVESPGGRWHAADAAAEAGLTVLGCTSWRDRVVTCPALDGTPCPLVTGADAVVVSYPPTGAEWDELLRTHLQVHPDVPVLVEGRAGDDLPDGVVALDVHDPALVVDRVAAVAGPRAARRRDAHPV